MQSDQVEVSPEMIELIGRPEIDRIVGQISAVGDCFICGNPLGNTKVTLQAQLSNPPVPGQPQTCIITSQHRRCHLERPPSKDQVMFVPNQTYRTLTAGYRVHRISNPIAPPEYAGLIVVPTVDHFTLHISHDGQVSDGDLNMMLRLGMVPLKRAFPGGDQPKIQASFDVTEETIYARFHWFSWEFEPSNPVNALIRQAGGAQLIFTTDCSVEQLRSGQAVQLLSASSDRGQTVGTWAPTKSSL